jgi:hypothetical protein
MAAKPFKRENPHAESNVLRLSASLFFSPPAAINSKMSSILWMNERSGWEAAYFSISA